jgi:hypothetical protein
MWALPKGRVTAIISHPVFVLPLLAGGKKWTAFAWFLAVTLGGAGDNVERTSATTTSSSCEPNVRDAAISRLIQEMDRAGETLRSLHSSAAWRRRKVEKRKLEKMILFGLSFTGLGVVERITGAAT